MLKPHSPSSPTRPPVEHLYFTIKHNEETIHFFTHAFGAAYAAHHWLTTILDTPATINWKSSACVELQHLDHTLTIKGSHLEDMIEYEPNKEEKQWTPPYPDSTHLHRAANFWETTSPTSRPTEPEDDTNNSTPPSKPSKKPFVAPRHKTQKKPTDSNTTTVAILASQYNLQPNKARQILRKANIQKPQEGWTFKLDDPILKKIRTLFEKG